MGDRDEYFELGTLKRYLAKMLFKKKNEYIKISIVIKVYCFTFLF